MEELLSIYIEAKECNNFKERHFSVWYNGSVLRHLKDGGIVTKLENVWPFGTKDERTVYSLHGWIRVPLKVATAFHGEPEYTYMVIDIYAKIRIIH